MQYVNIGHAYETLRPADDSIFLVTLLAAYEIYKISLGNTDSSTSNKSGALGVLWSLCHVAKRLYLLTHDVKYLDESVEYAVWASPFPTNLHLPYELCALTLRPTVSLMEDISSAIDIANNCIILLRKDDPCGRAIHFVLSVASHIRFQINLNQNDLVKGFEAATVARATTITGYDDDRFMYKRQPSP